MSTPAPPPPNWTRFDQISSEILNYAEVITAVAAGIPSPAQPFAVPALMIEKLLSNLIQTHMQITGQTFEQTVAQLHQITPV